VVLGKVTTVNRNSNVLKTPTGYLITIHWTGVFARAQIYYTSFSAGPPTCSGTAYLNAGTKAKPSHKHPTSSESREAM